MSKKRKLQYKDTDTLRFLALVPVYVYCGFFLLNSYSDGFISQATTAMGYLKSNSFDFFFFLSAFLLTSHGLREYKYFQSFKLRHFYVRRALKLAPVLIIAVIFAFLIHPWVLSILKLTHLEVPKMVNHFMLFPSDNGVFSAEQFILFSVIWVILMFVIFYLVLGFFLKFFKDQLKIVAFGFIVIGLLSRGYYVLTETDFDFNILAQGVSIGFGILTGLIVRNEKRTVEMFKELPITFHFAAYGIGLSMITFGYLFTSGTFFSLGVPLVTAVFFTYVMLEQTYSKNSIVKFRKIQLLKNLGKISYGFFVYQSIVSVITLIAFESLELNIKSLPIQILFFILGLVLTYIIADFSFKFIERPVSIIKREFKKS